ncbi:aspartate aminotransferase family protein [Thermodesulfobacterium commune]|uniref:Acetylornithine aminotransferase n=1 Tax=Thermodesulfobacterium commune DSM 2178 TaxID=289377 RepID=A0A075X0X9_9BACT|nr:aspartate aminotransferase family protein [Thermodesulfobacterium commune]AIH04637.1 acetylornithine aminotransferase [Thermodesulfobacterium commune DSM 2178]
MSYLADLGEIYLAPNYEREPIIFVRGEGTRLFTDKGEEYLDFTAGIAVCNLGHAHPQLVQVLKEQAECLWHTSNLYYTEPQVRLAKKLVELSFGDKVFFANSGTEAVEAALKLARRWAYQNFGGSKYKFISLKNSFHGRTLGSLSVTGQPKYWEGFEPLVPGVVFVEPNDLQELKETFDETVCAIIMEPIQGEGGVYPLTQEFIAQAKELCQKYSALLIFDEIQTGLGRTGRLFAYEHYGIEPDVMCLAKALANGLPLSAMIAKKEVIDFLTPGSHASTFGGNPIACAVGCKVVEMISDPTFLEEVELKGKVIMEKLRAYQEEYPGLIKQVRGKGLLIGIEFAIEVKPIYQELLKRRILTTTPKPNVLRLSPPLIINYREIDYFMIQLEEILKDIKT